MQNVSTCFIWNSVEVQALVYVCKTYHITALTPNELSSLVGIYTVIMCLLGAT